MEAQDYLAPSEAARSLGVSSIYVRKLMVQGKLRYIRTALGRLVEPESIEEFRAARASNVRSRYQSRAT